MIFFPFCGEILFTQNNLLKNNRLLFTPNTYFKILLIYYVQNIFIFNPPFFPLYFLISSDPKNFQLCRLTHHALQLLNFGNNLLSNLFSDESGDDSGARDRTEPQPERLSRALSRSSSLASISPTTTSLAI